jgi:hypothetical protein
MSPNSEKKKSYRRKMKPTFCTERYVYGAPWMSVRTKIPHGLHMQAGSRNFAVEMVHKGVITYTLSELRYPRSEVRQAESEVSQAEFYTGSRDSLSSFYFVWLRTCPRTCHSSVCLCAIIYVSRSLTSVLYF